MAVTSLADQLRDKEYKASNLKWVHYIQDHMDYIKETSEIVLINVNQMNSYKLRPIDFFLNLNVKYDLIWIAQFINGITDATKFIDKTYVFVPKESVLYDLQIRFNTYLKSL